METQFGGSGSNVQVLANEVVAIVDDDPSVRRGLKRLLQTQGWQVCTFSSAEEFQQRDTRLKLDVLLLDIYLPGITGLELLKRMQATEDGPGVVLMTAHAENETHDALLASGRTQCLRKPFNREQLMEAIQKIGKSGVRI